jgi:toxin ParE1/3/4
MSQFIISPTASQDLEEIIDYLSEQDFDLGEQFLAEFSQKCRNLSCFPKMGRSYAELAPQLRGVLLQKHVIFYRSFENGVEIIRVIGGCRDLTSFFEQGSDLE